LYGVPEHHIRRFKAFLMVKKLKNKKKSKRKIPKSPRRRTEGIRIPLKEHPQNISNWKRSIDGGKTWQEMSQDEDPIIGGVKIEGLPKVQTRNINDVDDRIEGLFKEAIDESEKFRKRKLVTKLNDCKHKMYAVRYHYLVIDTEINRQIEKYNKPLEEVWGVDKEAWNPKLVYETEAYLFQVRSNLDLIVQALGEIIPCLAEFDNASKKAVMSLDINNEKMLADFFRGQYNSRIGDLKHLRDTITHYSGLKDFQCFVEKGYKGGDEVQVIRPEIKTGVDLLEYFKATYRNLFNFYSAILYELKFRLTTERWHVDEDGVLHIDKMRKVPSK